MRERDKVLGSYANVSDFDLSQRDLNRFNDPKQAVILKNGQTSLIILREQQEIDRRLDILRALPEDLLRKSTLIDTKDFSVINITMGKNQTDTNLAELLISMGIKIDLNFSITN